MNEPNNDNNINNDVNNNNQMPNIENEINNNNNINNENNNNANNNQALFENNQNREVYPNKYTSITISFIIIFFINIIIEIYSNSEPINYRKYVFQYAPINEKISILSFYIKLFYSLWNIPFIS